MALDNKMNILVTMQPTDIKHQRAHRPWAYVNEVYVLWGTRSKALLKSKSVASVWCCEQTNGDMKAKYDTKLVIVDLDWKKPCWLESIYI